MNVKGIVVVSFVTLFGGVIPASAQFEVAPDHFESRAAAGHSEASLQKDIRMQIAEHQRNLASFQARIKAKYAEVQAALQDVFTNGTEAGQDLLFAARQKELEQLLKTLGPQVSAEEKTIASLQMQLPRHQQRASRVSRQQGRSNQLEHDVVLGPDAASTR